MSAHRAHQRRPPATGTAGSVVGTLRDVSRLGDAALEATGEDDVLRLLVQALRELDGGTVTLLAHDEQASGRSDRIVLPVLAGTTVVSVVQVMAPTGKEPTASSVAALVSTASVAITALRSARDARVDTLTQVLNRSALEQVLGEEVAKARRTGEPLSLVLLDLDDFKSVNDDLGHSAGDAVLREVGIALRTTLRPYDHVARLGGDEFVAVIPGVAEHVAAVTAERLRAEVGRRASSAVGRPVGCSAGIARLAPHLEPADVIDLADDALRAAKRDGRGRVASPPTDPSPPVRVEHEPAAPSADLLEALEGRGLQTLFQPICDLRDGRPVGYEALSRGPGSLARPDHLLARARAAGRLVELDEQLRRRAFALASGAGLRFPTTLFVNVERDTLLLMAEREDVWPRDDQPYPSLTEITERTLFAHPGRLLQACERLRELGWGVALDDVGQDPRALALLPLVAPDVIKLDLRLLRDRSAADIATVTIAATAEAQRSGALILAEGIETAEHEQRARSLGATLGQGWRFGRPQTAEEAMGATASALPIRRGSPASPPRGVTPFTVVAGSAPVHTADALLLAELQANLERRALGMGPLATLATSVPTTALDPGLERRLQHLSRDIGFTALLAQGAPVQNTRGWLSAPLPAGHPFEHEWVTVVTCPHYALTLVARRERPGSERWSYQLSHSVALGIQVAQLLFMEVHAVTA